MMKNISIACLFSLMFLTGCIKDTIKNRYTFYRPEYATKVSVQQKIRSDAPVAIQHPGKIFYRNGFVFLNEIGKGIHMIDIRNANSPRNVAFVHIPGTTDMAVRGDILYADLQTDLVAIDISNPSNVILKKVLNGLFNDLVWNWGYFDTTQVAVNWVKVDTTVSGNFSPSWGLREDLAASFSMDVALKMQSGGALNGVGGSMARFALLNDRMYAVGISDLKVINTSKAENPLFVKSVVTHAWDLETIFPLGDRLFIGSNSGMYIFDVSNPDLPFQAGKFQHARVCDPVISDGNTAYVTLRNGTECAGFINQLDVVDVQNIFAPSLIKSYPLFNPHGLAKDRDWLLICEGKEGLKIFNAADRTNIFQVGSLGGMNAFDVIAMDGLAIISANEGLFLVDYSQPNSPVIKSQIGLNK